MSNWKCRLEEVIAEAKGLESPSLHREREYRSVLYSHITDYINDNPNSDYLEIYFNKDLGIDSYVRRLFNLTFKEINYNEDI